MRAEKNKSIHLCNPCQVRFLSLVQCVKLLASPPKVDEDWQLILQQWRPEHWEIIILLYQQQYEHLSTVESKVHRPVSRLIDEINSPVDEQLGDLLVDPDTQTIANHLHATAETLVRWYLSSKR